jgi:hypothetical protein
MASVRRTRTSGLAVTLSEGKTELADPAAVHATLE